MNEKDDLLADYEEDTEAELGDAGYASIFSANDVSELVQIILQRFATLTLYVIEPYVALNDGDPLKIPAGPNYTIFDYGGRLVISPNDLYAVCLFSANPFLTAVEQGLYMAIEAGASEIAILGDNRAKNFIWDRCENLKLANKNQISIANYEPRENFIITREAVLRYLTQKGMQPVITPHLSKLKPNG